MNLVVCKKICNECPFKKGSLQGYLGDLTLEETLNAQQFEQLFSCHLHRGEDSTENKIAIEAGIQPICRGYMISAQLSCKSFGQNNQTGKYLKELMSSMNITEKEKLLIMTRWEMRNYHTI